MAIDERWLEAVERALDERFANVEVRFLGMDSRSRDGRSVIIGQQRASSDIVLFDRTPASP